jgi:hypothetical protein
VLATSERIARFAASSYPTAAALPGSSATKRDGGQPTAAARDARLPPARPLSYVKIGPALIVYCDPNAQHEAVTTPKKVAMHLSWWVIAAALGFVWSGILLVTLMRVSGDSSSRCDAIGE